MQLHSCPLWLMEPSAQARHSVRFALGRRDILSTLESIRKCEGLVQQYHPCLAGDNHTETEISGLEDMLCSFELPSACRGRFLRLAGRGKCGMLA